MKRSSNGERKWITLDVLEITNIIPFFPCSWWYFSMSQRYQGFHTYWILLALWRIQFQLALYFGIICTTAASWLVLQFTFSPEVISGKHTFSLYLKNIKSKKARLHDRYLAPFPFPLTLTWKLRTFYFLLLLKCIAGRETTLHILWSKCEMKFFP